MQSLPGEPSVLIIGPLRMTLVESRDDDAEKNLAAGVDLLDDYQRGRALRVAVRERSSAYLQREEHIEGRAHIIVGHALDDRSKHPEENPRQLEMAARAAQRLRAIDRPLVESDPFDLEQPEARAFERAHHTADGQQRQAHESNQTHPAR